MQAEPLRWTTEELLAEAQWLARLARRLVGSPAEADDVAQDTWIAALQRPPERARPLRPWLARVARNAARSRRRSEGARAAREASGGNDEGATSAPDELAQRLEGQRLLVDALARLREPLRSTLVLAYFEHLGSEEIARREGVSAGTVRWRVSTGVAELRAEMGRRNGGAWALALAPLARTESGAAPASIPLTLGGTLVTSLAKLAATAAVVVLGVHLVTRSRTAPELTGGGAPDAPLALAPETPRPPDREPAAPGERAAVAPSATAATAAEETASQAPSVAAATTSWVEATFFSPDGEPLAGVALEPLEGAPRAASERSARDGSVRVEIDVTGPERSDRWLLAHAPGRASRAILVVPVPGWTIRLGTQVLAAGGDVAGRVVGADGAGVAGAVVALDELVTPESELDSHAPSALDVRGRPHARTDGDGAFVLAGAPAGFVRLVAGREGFRATFGAPLEVRAGETSAGVELVLEPLDSGSFVAGIVLDPLGAPAAGARVAYRFELDGGGGSGSALAGADGRFRLEARPGATFELAASDAEEALGMALARGVGAGETALVLRLAPARELEVLVSSGGKPLERFRASAREASGFGAAGDSGIGPHALGRAVLAARAPSILLTVQADGFERAELGPLGEEERRIEVELARVPGVRGRVVADGRGVAGAEVAAHARRAGVAHSMNGLPSRFGATSAWTTTDEDGAFVLTLREAGDFSLLVDASGFATAELELDDYEPARGRDGLVLELDAGGSIEGRVLAPPGLAAAGTIVAFSRGDGRAFTLRVGPDGRYRADHLSAGRWYVSAVDEEIRADRRSGSSTDGEGDVPWNCEVTSGAVTRFDLDLAPEARLAGRVALDGAPAGAWRAQLGAGAFDPSLEGVASAQLDPEGAFVFAARAGEATLYLTAIGGALDGLRLVRPLELVLGENQLDLDLSAARVEVDGAGEDLALVWLGERGAFGVRLMAGDGGAGVPAGRVRLARFDPMLSDPDPRNWPVLDEAVVEAGASATLRARR